MKKVRKQRTKRIIDPCKESPKSKLASVQVSVCVLWEKSYTTLQSGSKSGALPEDFCVITLATASKV